MTPLPPNAWSAAALAEAIRSGELSATDALEACLARIAEREATVHAFAHIDPGHARAQARARDRQRREGRPLGALHGVPVAVKDIFDTADMPTACGTDIFAGRRPERDATAVWRLRQAGAVIIGKTVTTELAAFTPNATRNPLDPGRTPGGSSSGSAAAVADHMVPVALGSQTNGSVVRPASFCGVVGLKPTFGLIPRTGMLRHDRELDHAGIFARTVEDAALVTDILTGFDPADPDTRLEAPPGLLSATLEEPETPFRLAFAPTPMWPSAETTTRDAFAELTASLGDMVEAIELPEVFERAIETHATIWESGLARAFGALLDRDPECLSPRLQEMVERGGCVLAVDRHRALDDVRRMRLALDRIFEHRDAILTAAAPGEAPVGEATGDPVFCTTWTLVGVPALSLPLLSGPNGLPLGVQLVGPAGEDGRLLRTARWLQERVCAKRGT